MNIAADGNRTQLWYPNDKQSIRLLSFIQFGTVLMFSFDAGWQGANSRIDVHASTFPAFQYEEMQTELYFVLRIGANLPEMSENSTSMRYHCMYRGDGTGQIYVFVLIERRKAWHLAFLSGESQFQKNYINGLHFLYSTLSCSKNEQFQSKILLIQ